MTKPIDLRADLAKIVHEIIVHYLPAGVSVRVFGSRANWTAKSHSDLDLALKGRDKLPSSLINELTEAFSESDLPIRVDVVDWHTVPPQLQAVIKRDGLPFTIQLGEIATLLSGGTPSKSNEAFWGGEIPWLTPKDMSHWDGTTQAHVTDASIGRGTRLAPPNAVFVAVRGMSLHNEIRVIRSEKPITFNQDIKAIVAGPLIDPLFLFYAITAAKGELLGLVSAAGHGTGVLDTDRLRSLALRSLPLVEQRSIARVIGAIDDKIELNRKMNETLEAMARAIFKDWFVDFGPTRAKMEGRAPYLAPDIWSLFPDRLDDEGKPEGWSGGSLSDFAVLNPESWSRANYPERIDYVDLSNTKWGTIETVTRFTSDAAPSRAQRILRPGDTVVGTVRPGNGSYAFVSANGLTGSTGFAVLRPTREIYREAIYLAATSKENIERLAHLADGGAYPAVRPELLAATELTAAPESVFSAFSAATSALVDRAEANKSESHTLAATRDFLLPKLMSGEICVKDAEALI